METELSLHLLQLKMSDKQRIFRHFFAAPPPRQQKSGGRGRLVGYEKSPLFYRLSPLWAGTFPDAD